MLAKGFLKYLLSGLVCAVSALAGATVVKPGDNLQAVLNKGEDLELQKGAVYEISAILRYKTPGQKVYTRDAQFPSEYATLRLVNKDQVTILDAYAVDEAVLERVLCDGNRYKLGVRPYPTKKKVHQPGIANFGGADNQIVRNCVFMNARGFSNIVFHRGGTGPLVENNMILGAGVDARGNGREANEPPRRWSDGVSCAAPRARVRNNLILDPTDVGIVFYGAPGAVAESNVVASISRESLGGINLVDAFDWLAIDEEESAYDYRGTTVRDNYIDAYGSRIHVGIPVGAGIWTEIRKGMILTGGSVLGNEISGEALGYGIAVEGVTDFTIRGNKVTATCSGVNRYARIIPDDPAPLLFDKETVINCDLQPDFQESERSLIHLLRVYRAPEDELGYALHDYGEPELKAVIYAAYKEMLGRKPKTKEMKAITRKMEDHDFNADGLRRRIMEEREFQRMYGEVPPEELHPWRVKRWFDLLDTLIRENGGMPPALTLYKDALSRL